MTEMVMKHKKLKFSVHGRFYLRCVSFGLSLNANAHTFLSMHLILFWHWEPGEITIVF